MNQFLEAKNLFKDDFDLEGYLDSFSFEHAKTELLRSLNSPDIPLIFLLGNPGYGKSYLLKFIEQRADAIKIAKFISLPYFTEREFLENLVEIAGVQAINKRYDLEVLMKTLKDRLNPLEYTIIIDEAQLLNHKQMELIRILSDMRIFKFLLAMHKKDGHKILSKSHFKSRTNSVVYMEALKKEEIERYITNRLLSRNLSNIVSAFDSSDINFIYKISQGNFRLMKKLLSTLFEIIDAAQQENLKKYSKIREATLTMAAIDIGLINVK